MSDGPFFAILMCALTFAVGMFLGNADGHRTVALECERLGAFYVGTTTYSCAPKGETK